MENRYYVQCLTDQVFVIRERVSPDEAPGASDRIVRSFDVRHDAFMYVDNANEQQRKLDETLGPWVQRAI